MAKLVTLKATYRIVTPMFLGGANQKQFLRLTLGTGGCHG